MLCALGLCGLYGYVLHLARNPEVTDAYRAYYIDRSSDVPVWLAEVQPGNMKPLAVGKPYAHTSPDITLVGWSNAESGHVWTLGHQAMLFFLLPADVQPNQSYDLVLEGFYLGGEQLITSWVDGNEITHTYRDGEEIVIPLQIASFGERPVGVRLDLPHARAPGTQDQRVLSFALQSVLLLEVDPRTRLSR